MGVGSRDADAGRPAKGRLLTPHRETGVAGRGTAGKMERKGCFRDKRNKVTLRLRGREGCWPVSTCCHSAAFDFWPNESSVSHRPHNHCCFFPSSQ